MTRGLAAAAMAAVGLLGPAPGQPAATRGLTAAAEVASVYDLILDAGFPDLPARVAATCPPAPAEACLVVEAAGVWWQINLDPRSRALDARAMDAVGRAIGATGAWTAREPGRAEAWFYRGAAYGVRAQVRVVRGERLAAARDGARIKRALERALELDPALVDAQFGIGLYRYYADVAPAVLRWLRWLFLLSGGDRTEGLAQMQAAADQGVVTRWEAAYQLHLAYLWYERRFADALAIVQQLAARFPRNPHFAETEAGIRAEYFSDAAGSLRVSETIERRALAGEVNEAALALTAARLNIAAQSARLGDRDRAIAILERLVAERPAAPAGAVARAVAQLRAIRR